MKTMNYLVVSKENYQGNLGSLCAGLRSSKKSYIAYSDNTVTHRAVLKTVLIPEADLAQLDKAVKPLYWNVLKDLEAEQGLREFSVRALKGTDELGDLYSAGLPLGSVIAEATSLFDYSKDGTKLVVLPNKYSIITVKF